MRTVGAAVVTGQGPTIEREDIACGAHFGAAVHQADTAFQRADGVARLYRQVVGDPHSCWGHHSLFEGANGQFVGDHIPQINALAVKIPEENQQRELFFGWGFPSVIDLVREDGGFGLLAEIVRARPDRAGWILIAIGELSGLARRVGFEPFVQIVQQFERPDEVLKEIRGESVGVMEEGVYVRTEYRHSLEQLIRLPSELLEYAKQIDGFQRATEPLVGRDCHYHFAGYLVENYGIENLAPFARIARVMGPKAFEWASPRWRGKGRRGPECDHVLELENLLDEARPLTDRFGMEFLADAYERARGRVGALIEQTVPIQEIYPQPGEILSMLETLGDSLERFSCHFSRKAISRDEFVGLFSFDAAINGLFGITENRRFIREFGMPAVGGVLADLRHPPDNDFFLVLSACSHLITSIEDFARISCTVEKLNDASKKFLPLVRHLIDSEATLHPLDGILARLAAIFGHRHDVKKKLVSMVASIARRISDLEETYVLFAADLEANSDFWFFSLPFTCQDIHSMEDLREFAGLSRRIESHFVASPRRRDRIKETATLCASREIMRNWLAMREGGLVPTAYLLDQLVAAADRTGLLAEWHAIRTSFRYGQFDPEDELHRNLMCTIFRKIADHDMEEDRPCQTEVDQVIGLIFRRDFKTDDEEKPFPFLEENLPLLLQSHLVGEEGAAIVAWNLPDLFSRYFHRIREEGLLTRAAFNRVIAQSRCRPEVAGVLANIGEVPGWLESPRRWDSLIKLLKDSSKAARFGRLFQAIARSSIAASKENLAHFVTLLSDLPEEEEKIFDELEKCEPLDQGWHTTLADLEETSRIFGVSDHPAFLAMKSRIEKGGENLLADWTLSGMREAWSSYRGVAEVERKKVRKKFINFLEQQLRRPIPSLVTLWARRIEKIQEECFIRRLNEGGSGRIEMERNPMFVRLHSSPLYSLLMKAASFMEPAGIDAIRRLILGLKIDERGRLIYPRYEELRGVVSDSFLNRWREDYFLVPEGLQSLDDLKGRQALMKQTFLQVRDHARIPKEVEAEKVPETIRNLPARVEAWLSGLAVTDDPKGPFVAEASPLLSQFESHYQMIRAHFGDLFADIRIDLRNFVMGMERGIKVARKGEQIVVSGDIERIGRSGHEPVETCQNLLRPWVNRQGQPIHRILHGQFKVANWEIDGTVAARRLLEVTVDEEGGEHLLVERLYTYGGFGRVEEFEREILCYAETLGISVKRVHFSDKLSQKSAPAALRTGDEIYRDTFRVEGPTLDEVRKRG